MLRTSVSNRQSITLHETNGGTWALIWIFPHAQQHATTVDFRLLANEIDQSIHLIQIHVIFIKKHMNLYHVCGLINQESGGEYVSANIMHSHPNTKKILPPKKSVKKGHPPKGTASNGKARALQKDPPAGSKKSLNNTATPNSRRWVLLRHIINGRYSGHRRCNHQC